MGSRFDQHYAGTYYALKMGTFNLQYTLAYCRPAQGWSNRRPIACNQEMAVQLGNGQKLQVGGGGNWKRARKTPTLNGRGFVNQRKSFNIDGLTVTAYCSGSNCQIEHPDFSVLLRNMPPYNDYTVTFKKRNGKFIAAGRCGGTCGGLGRQQYHGGYPCRSCIPGGAYRTKICRCQEWAVPRSQSAVQHWAASATKAMVNTATLAESSTMAESSTKTSKLVPTKLQGDTSQMSAAQKAALEEKRQACLKAFKGSTYMKSTMEKCFHTEEEKEKLNKDLASCDEHHKDLATEVHRLSEDCAMDTDNDDADDIIHEYEGVFCAGAFEEAEAEASFKDHHCHANNGGLVNKCWNDQSLSQHQSFRDTKAALGNHNPCTATH